MDHWTQDEIDDDCAFDDDNADWMYECGLGRDGQCSMAGTEHCDFDCPMRNTESFCGSAAWIRKYGK